MDEIIKKIAIPIFIGLIILICVLMLAMTQFYNELNCYKGAINGSFEGIDKSCAMSYVNATTQIKLKECFSNESKDDLHE